ncbi:peroxidase [Artemisia annua]|uniref:peroxidase n=1 Tax=Artemisia annua TaxID=35608 RepID=A0A2U1LFU2_ARTAN|nr:peroxidase [Artemisia annua]
MGDVDLSYNRRVFDNVYFQNLPKGLGVLKSDRGLVMNKRTRGYVEWYATDQKAFFRHLGRRWRS